MSALAPVVALALHLALLLAAAPLLVGLLRLMRARLLGRAGASPLQPWRDLRRLARKQSIIAETGSWLLRVAPAVDFAASLVAAALVPSFALGMASAPAADLLVFAGLLGLGRAATALAALDAGTGFGGLGASRAMTFSVFAEPALLLVIFIVALLAGATNLDAVAATVHEGSFGLRVPMVLALAAAVAITVALVENGRLPVGDPASSRELAMVHEALLLDYSGRELALLEWAAALRLLVWMSLIGVVFAPFGVAPADAPLAWPLGLAAWAGKALLLAGGLALLEASRARMQLFRVPEFVGVAILLGLLAVIFLFVSQGFA